MGVALNMSPLSKTFAEQDRNAVDHNRLRNVFDAPRPLGDDFEFDLDENDVSEASSASTTSTPRGPQTTVRFSPIVEYYDIISLNDYAEKELRRCWYSSEEKERMNRNKDKTVARLEAGKPARGDTTYQGLQCWTAQGGKALDESIALVVNSVMDEQDRQWAANVDDFERIAQISAAATAHSAKAALENGLNDEMEARLAWETEEIGLFSEHSNEAEDFPVLHASRAELFTVPKGLTRKRSKVQPAFGMGTKTPEESREMYLKTSSKDMFTPSMGSEKSTKRPSMDPPARVERTPSQDATEVLFRMRAVSRKMAPV